MRFRSLITALLVLALGGPALAQTPQYANPFRMPTGLIPQASGALGFINWANSTPNQTCTNNGSNSTTVASNTMLCMHAHLTVPMGTNSGFDYMANFDMEATNTGSDQPVTLYSHMKMNAGAQGAWAFNTVLDIASGVTAGSALKGAIANEFDVNNWNCNEASVLSSVTTGGCPESVGLLMIGASPFTTSRAIQITGVSGVTPQWQDGIIFTGNHIAGTAISDYSASPISFNVAGSHVVGFDCANGTISSACIRLGNNKRLNLDTAGLHGVFWDASSGTYIWTGNSGATAIAQMNGSNGGMYPSVVGVGAAMGLAANPYDNMYSKIFDIGQPGGTYASLSADSSGNLLISAPTISAPSAGLSGTSGGFACWTAPSGGNRQLVFKSTAC